MKDNFAPRRPSQDIPWPTHGLWSLWDLMLKQSALEFGRAMSGLASLERSCEHVRITHPEILFDGSGQLKDLAIQVLGNLKRVCILGDLTEVIPEIDRFGVALAAWPQGVRIEDAKSRAEHLRDRIFDELKSDYFFQVDRHDVRFYDKQELFGPLVAKTFKGASQDIKNAGNCLALQQATACVFHLMRAMEVAVRQLSRRLNLTITPQTTWRQLTGGMDQKIKTMPETTEEQKLKKGDWEAARANLHHVGSVWRNRTMHPAASYTPSQAHDVFNAVRVFMNGLCAL